jgi:SPOR domain
LQLLCVTKFTGNIKDNKTSIMKNITTLAVVSLFGIIGSLIALNYYVNYYKPQKQVASLSKSPVEPSAVLSTDSLKGIPTIISTPVAATPTTVPTHSAPAKPVVTEQAKVAPTKSAPQQTAHVPKSLPKSANLPVAPPAKPVVPAKIVPQTIPADAGITAKGADAVIHTGLTKGLHYVIIGSFADENNAKTAMHNYPLNHLSIYKDDKLYRLSAGAFATTAAAKVRMAELQRQSVESMMIQH